MTSRAQSRRPSSLATHGSIRSGISNSSATATVTAIADTVAAATAATATATVPAVTEQKTRDEEMAHYWENKKKDRAARLAELRRSQLLQNPTESFIELCRSGDVSDLEYLLANYKNNNNTNNENTDNNNPNNSIISINDTRGFHQSTGLHNATRYGHLSLVQYLIANGAIVDSIDEYSTTPLMLAAIYNHLPVLNALIAAGANPVLTDQYGQTALTLASAAGNNHCSSRIISAIVNGPNPAGNNNNNNILGKFNNNNNNHLGINNHFAPPTLTRPNSGMNTPVR